MADQLVGEEFPVVGSRGERKGERVEEDKGMNEIRHSLVHWDTANTIYGCGNRYKSTGPCNKLLSLFPGHKIHIQMLHTLEEKALCRTLKGSIRHFIFGTPNIEPFLRDIQP